ncbi:MAG: hypothetical protein H6634_06800 [Anaerolineales bacterium]|nr:hypothetical protein [Anaerolineales bacterium]MCB9110940.1 hypothetical protein [Anaerolineales bacterium]
MSKRSWSQNILPYVGIGIIVALVLSLLLDSSNGFGGSEIFTGIALILAVGAVLYLKNMQNVLKNEVNRRVKAEYAPEVRPEVFKIYQRLGAKELDGLFPIILDNAEGSLNKVKKLANIAEGVGWKAFIENQW